jgi:hypothetical protein
MNKFIKYTCILIALAVIPFLSASCTGKAGPPGPIAETPIPIVLKFVEPEDLKIDVEAIGGGQDVTASASKVAVGEDISHIIENGPELVDEVEMYGIDFLDGIGEIEVPIGTDVTTFQRVVTFSEASIVLEGEREVKIDFSPFDFDNDGSLEPCSGHTATLPICARVWLDDLRFVAWIFESYPFPDDPNTAANEKDIGSGRFKAFLRAVSQDKVQRAAFTVNYEQAGVDEKTIDHFLDVTLKSEKAPFFNIPAETPVHVDVENHTEVSQSPLSESLLKRINTSRHLTVRDLETMEIVEDGEFGLQYLGQFLEGEDFWSGSIADLIGGAEEFTDACARISTGLVVEQSFCDDLDIRVLDAPFVRPFEDSDVAVPDGFLEFAPF